MPRPMPRADRRRAGTAGLHQRGARQEPFRRRRRARLPGRARVDQGARSPHRNRDLSRVRERGRGAVVGARTCCRTHERRSAVAVRALRRVRRRRARPALRGVGRGVAGLGAAERLFGSERPATRRRGRSRCRSPRVARSPLPMSTSPIRRGRQARCWTACPSPCGGARRWPSSDLRAPARARSFI